MTGSNPSWGAIYISIFKFSICVQHCVYKSREGMVLARFDSPYQKRPFCLSWSWILKILVFLGPDQKSTDK